MDIREELDEGLHSAAQPGLQDTDEGRAQPHMDAQNTAAKRRASRGAARHGALPAVEGVQAMPKGTLIHAKVDAMAVLHGKERSFAEAGVQVLSIQKPGWNQLHVTERCLLYHIAS